MPNSYFLQNLPSTGLAPEKRVKSRRISDFMNDPLVSGIPAPGPGAGGPGNAEIMARLGGSLAGMPELGSAIASMHASRRQAAAAAGDRARQAYLDRVNLAKSLAGEARDVAIDEQRLSLGEQQLIAAMRENSPSEVALDRTKAIGDINAQVAATAASNQRGEFYETQTDYLKADRPAAEQKRDMELESTRLRLKGDKLAMQEAERISKENLLTHNDLLEQYKRGDMRPDLLEKFNSSTPMVFSYEDGAKYAQRVSPFDPEVPIGKKFKVEDFNQKWTQAYDSQGNWLGSQTIDAKGNPKYQPLSKEDQKVFKATRDNLMIQKQGDTMTLNDPGKAREEVEQYLTPILSSHAKQLVPGLNTSSMTYSGFMHVLGQQHPEMHNTINSLRDAATNELFTAYNKGTPITTSDAWNIALGKNPKLGKLLESTAPPEEDDTSNLTYAIRGVKAGAREALEAGKETVEKSGILNTADQTSDRYTQAIMGTPSSGAKQSQPVQSATPMATPSPAPTPAPTITGYERLKNEHDFKPAAELPANLRGRALRALKDTVTKEEYEQLKDTAIFGILNGRMTMLKPGFDEEYWPLELPK